MAFDWSAWRGRVRSGIKASAAALLADKETAAALDGALERLRPYLVGLGLDDWTVVTRRGAGPTVEVELIEPGRNRSMSFGMALPRPGQGAAAVESYFTELLEGMALAVRRRLDAEGD